MAAEPTPEIWAGVATQYVGAWGQAAPVVQIAAIVAAVVIAAIIAWAWSRKSTKTVTTGVPVEAFAHVVEEQARQTEALRAAVEGLAEIVLQTRMLLETRTLCPFSTPRCGEAINHGDSPC
jgi:hypothetical protein